MIPAAAAATTTQPPPSLSSGTRPRRQVQFKEGANGVGNEYWTDCVSTSSEKKSSGGGGGASGGGGGAGGGASPTTTPYVTTSSGHVTTVYPSTALPTTPYVTTSDGHTTTVTPSPSSSSSATLTAPYVTTSDGQNVTVTPPPYVTTSGGQVFTITPGATGAGGGNGGGSGSNGGGSSSDTGGSGSGGSAHHTGAIVGGVVGGVVGAMLLLLCAWCCCCRTHRRRKHPKFHRHHFCIRCGKDFKKHPRPFDAPKWQSCEVDRQTTAGKSLANTPRGALHAAPTAESADPDLPGPPICGLWQTGKCDQQDQPQCDERGLHICSLCDGAHRADHCKKGEDKEDEKNPEQSEKAAEAAAEAAAAGSSAAGGAAMGGAAFSSDSDSESEPLDRRDHPRLGFLSFGRRRGSDDDYDEENAMGEGFQAGRNGYDAVEPNDWQGRVAYRFGRGVGLAGRGARYVFLGEWAYKRGRGRGR